MQKIYGWIQFIGESPCFFFGETDPREIHDNGKPTFPLYRIPEGHQIVDLEKLKTKALLCHYKDDSASLHWPGHSWENENDPDWTRTERLISIEIVIPEQDLMALSCPQER